jgi:hypothetical protein
MARFPLLPQSLKRAGGPADSAALADSKAGAPRRFADHDSSVAEAAKRKKADVDAAIREAN